MIELGDESTWPARVHARLKADCDNLVAYEAERRRIDALINSDDIRWRLSPPTNEHQRSRDATIREIDALIADETILAWHCTRLLLHERSRLIPEGLKRHSRTLFKRRMADAVACGALSLEAADALVEGSQIEDFGRADLLHVVLDRGTLQDEGAVGDLLRHWGGEAVYNNARRSRKGRLAPLAELGEPAIVELCFPLSYLADLWVSIGERLANRFLDRLGVPTSDGWRCDGKLRRDLPGATIIRVIGPHDGEFAALTQQGSWDQPLACS